MLSDEQKKLRLGRIGSSQIAALVGLHPFKTPIQVFREATEPEYQQEPNEMLEIGTLLEPVVLELYGRRSGKEWESGWTLTPERWPFAVATPDALAYSTAETDAADLIVEAKTCMGFAADGWGEPGTDQVPPAYLCQTQWQMGIGREHGLPIKGADVPVLIGGFDFRVYSVPFDEALFGSLLEAAERFWTGHIKTGVPPPVDGSDAYADFLKDRFPKDRAPLLAATDEHEEMMRALREAEAAKKSADHLYELTRNRLRNAIGEAEGIEGAAGRVTWKANKNGVRALKPKWRDEA